ncbi:MAG: SnoaL-like polyketide cyclase [Mycobacterium sp.]|nr:SnoaL-like polyketide cyclase [Mycobacterium sp.]
MDTSGFDRYVDAWLLHPLAGAPDGGNELKALLMCCSPDVRYEDVPTATVFEGHDGLTRMCQGAHNWSSDVQATAVLTRQTNGKLFAVETEWRGTNTAPVGNLPATGRRFTLRMLSVGAVDHQGL